MIEEIYRCVKKVFARLLLFSEFVTLLKKEVTLSLTINRSLVRSVIVQRICHPYEKRGDIERKGTKTIIGTE
jgi:hypothetical protein